MSNEKEFHQSLPTKRMGAGCLFLNEARAILLVKPTYKPSWEIPGGIVENHESPKLCCQREIHEELGLTRPIGRLLVIDYNSQQEAYTESLMFIFYGGVLTTADIESIVLPPTELSEFRFFDPAVLPATLSNRLKNRILAAWQQAKMNSTVYLEDQTPK